MLMRLRLRRPVRLSLFAIAGLLVLSYFSLIATRTANPEATNVATAGKPPLNPKSPHNLKITDAALQAGAANPRGLVAAFHQAQHQVERQGTGFRLQNPENQLHAEFHDGAMTAEHPEGRLGLRLEGYGYGDKLATPTAASVHAAGTRIEYQRGALTEWYVNEARGLEQGFTLRERPGCPDGGPLEIEMAVSGNLEPKLVGEHIELRRDGRAVLLYTGLRAWDSKGRTLSGQMDVRDGRIQLLVSDRDAAYPITIDPWVQQQEISDPGATAGDLFGTSVSVNGTTAVIGAPAGNGSLGAAYVFTLSAGTWTQQQELTAGDGASGDEFGASVAVNGNLIVVGAPGKNANTGAAYVFIYSPGIWSQQAELTASDGGEEAFFGFSVAVNGLTAVVGAYGWSEDGAVYIYLLTGTTWSLQQEIFANDRAAGDEFGYSVSVSGNILIVGAPQHKVTKTNQGVAYAFTRSGTTWTQQTPDIVAKAPAAAAIGDNFGSSVSLDVVSSVPTALIGAPQRTNATGLVYVFTEPVSTWTQQTTLTAGDAATGDLFGTSVSLSGTAAVIGAPDHTSTGSNSGAAYEFTGSGSSWTQQATDLQASDAAKNDVFGSSVSVNGTTAVIGAPGKKSSKGAAYMFDLTPWTISSANSTTFTVGTAGTFTVTTTGTPTPSLSETGALPTGVTFVDQLNGTALLSGTPQAGTGDAYTITITASGAGNSATQTFTLTVDEPPTINSANATTFTVGTLGTFQVTTGSPGAPGFPLPTFSETGSLPVGVTFTSGGTLSGTPAAGTGNAYPIMITASNGVSPNSTQSFTLTVDQPPAITSPPSTTFIVGTNGSFAATATGYPAPTFNKVTGSGTLPNGVSLDPSGVLSGTPASGTGGVYTFTLRASNGVTPAATQAFTLTVDEAPAITSAKKTTFTVGQPGTFTVMTSGYPAASLSEPGGLPTGVTFTSNGDGTATLAGTPLPTTGGTYPFTITANNTISPNATQNFILTVDEAPTITSANVATFKTSSSGSFTVTASGYPASTFTETGALPSGVTLSSSGSLSGTPAAGTGGIYAIMIDATNGVSPDSLQSFTLTVNQPPSITSAPGTTFTVGTMGTFAVTASGYPASFTFTETGTLPAGVTLSSSGVLSGTPTGKGGLYPITITAANGITPKGTQSFTLTLDQAPAITSAKKTTFTVGQAGTFTVKTSGYPTSALSETGSLPDGVTFGDNGDGTGTLMGTPLATTGGTYPITITANNGVSPNAMQNFTLTVNEAPSITSANNATFTTGTLGSFTVTASGYPASTFTETGALPSGVTLSSSGLLSGTPGPTTGGVYAITITANNGTAPNATQSFTLTVDQPPVITSANHTTFTTGTAGTFTVTASGFPISMTFSETGALPSGVTLSSAGLLSGTPAAGTGGTYSITITASNGISPDGTQPFTLTVDQAPAITSANSTTFTVGTAGTFTVTATGFPAPTFSETGALPTGVTLSAAGLLSGTPAAGTGGVYTITITAKNGTLPNATQSFTLTVDQAPAITSANYAGFAIGVAGSFTVTTTGYPAPSITEAGPLPNGLTFVDNGNGTGTLSGTPLVFVGGNFSISFTAQNGIGSPVTQPFTIILGQAPAFTSVNSAAFTYGAPNSFTVMATGFPTPSLSEIGGLPAGVTFVDNGNGTGTLSGTPVAAGNYNVVFAATNAVATSTQPFTLNVAGLSFTPASLNFYAVYLNSSNTITLTVTNMDTFPVNITGISITPGTADAASYKFVSHCAATLKPNASCTIAVTFVPDAVGVLTATLNLTDNAPGSPQQISLSGIAIDPVAQFDPTSVAFGSQAVGSSTTLPVQLTNSGLTPLIISNIAVTGANSGEFTQVNNCPEAPESLASTMSCTISVTFAPTVKGARTGTLTITDNVAAGQSTVALTGTGH